MPVILDVSAEQLAKLFHHYREALTRDVNPDNRAETLTWEDTPREERNLLIAAAELALLDLSEAETSESVRKYYAAPGRAEWGC